MRILKGSDRQSPRPRGKPYVAIIVVVGIVLFALGAYVAIMGTRSVDEPLGENPSIRYEAPLDDGGKVVDEEKVDTVSEKAVDDAEVVEVMPEEPVGSEWYDMTRDEKTEVISQDFDNIEWVGDTDCFFDSEGNFWYVSYGQPYLQYDSDMVEEIGKEVIINDALGEG